MFQSEWPRYSTGSGVAHARSNITAMFPIPREIMKPHRRWTVACKLRCGKAYSDAHYRRQNNRRIDAMVTTGF